MPVMTKAEAKLPAAIRVDLGAIFVSLELSKSPWLVTALAPGSEKMSRYSVVGGDLAGLFGCFGELRRTIPEGRSLLSIFACPSASTECPTYEVFN